MKWYHEKKEKTKRKYLQGYYPKHFRAPNLIVCWLYEVGYFFGDFVPLLMNLIEGIYQVIRRIVAFVATLLIEASTGVVLLGTIAFSVFHSIDFLRRSGAVGGLEYVGVFMFEVVFISSTATMTASLMRKEWPNPFSIIGFILGIAFVEISNVTAMNPTWEGISIGIATPVLLIISEGILAYQFMRSKSELKIMPELDETREKNEQKSVAEMNETELKKSQKPSDVVVHDTEKTVENDTENGEGTNHEMVPEVVLETDKKDTENGTKIDSKMVQKMVVHDTENKLENGTEIDGEMVLGTSEKPVTENGTDPNRNMVEKTVEDDTGKDGGKQEKSTAEEIQEVPENETKPVPESDEKTVTKMVEKDAKNEDESNQNSNQKTVEKTSENTTKINTETNTKTDAKNGTEIELNEDKKTVLNDTEIKQENGIKETKNKTKKSTKRTKVDPDAKKIKQAAKRVSIP